MNKKNLRNLPSVDGVLKKLENKGVFISRGIKNIVRTEIDLLREEILSGQREPSLTREENIKLLISRCEKRLKPRMQKIINASGIILHTNLGRAPLCQSAVEAFQELSAGYCNLEFEIEEGRRGSRQDICSDLLSCLTGAEKALVVNNNAAAVLLVLDTFVRGSEAIVSRGELVEIGGSFRVPEVMAKSGVQLREVGTTNRTRIEDYERAINSETKMVMKVHPSNYRISGFTEDVSPDELARLAEEYNLLSYYDLGSGSLWDEGLLHLVQNGPDLLSFSGDKLLGGPQAGIILGRAKLIDRMAQNNLARALRIDKLSLIALEATLQKYLTNEFSELPVYRMLNTSNAELEKRTQKVLEELKPLPQGLKGGVDQGSAYSGGGTLPEEEIPGPVLVIWGNDSTLNQIQRNLRKKQPPVVISLFKRRLEINLRTVFPDEENILVEYLKEIVQGVGTDGRKEEN